MRPWKRKRILGLPVDLVRRDELLRAVPAMVRAGGSHHLVALNPIKVMRAQEESDLREGIEEAAVVYPDAVGISWALRTLHRERVPVLPGCELMVDLFRLAGRHGYRVFLVGARPSVLDDMCRRLLAEYPGLVLAGSQHGYFADHEQPDVIARVRASRADLLFVAMGAHKQETFVRALQRDGAEVPVVMSVGGSFDAFTGAVPRPPRWMLRLRLEWLYRLVRQPFRAPRMIALPRFACRVLQLRFASRHGVD